MNNRKTFNAYNAEHYESNDSMKCFLVCMEYGGQITP